MEFHSWPLACEGEVPSGLCKLYQGSRHGRRLAYAEGTMLDLTSRELAEGLGCYQREAFFATHEHWELVWLETEEPEKSFVQALIQVAAAFHHWQRGNQA